ncbi:hypothetical protein DEU56DRAFT_275902 [Suillus clintonianus]|uniref:uncharacterized protein n=1 Tax=Suillus clintonianus TaxID=1904413 RepID=UPI001B87B010|nr:uncharacterized protein DEU56DRAFT_275902 [Suillus clintonianus]KAG2141301.1 hypothetical protein DEU56DRAFT_275902 [Suillus clintonianus]
MSWNASVLSSLSSDTEPAVVIAFDSAKYIFNVGENTTRAFLQSRRNWKKTRGVFLTSVGTQRASGLPGLLMTFADSGLTSLNVAGPAGLLHFMAAMRKYTFRENLSVNPIEIPTSRLPDDSSDDDILIYKDDNISVFALPVSADVQSLEVASESVTLPHSETSVVNMKSGKRKRSPSPAAPLLHEVISHPNFDPTTLVGDMAQEWLRDIVRTMFPGSAAKPIASSTKVEHVSQPSGFNRPLPSLPPCNRRATLAYAVVGPRVRGRFDVKRAEALGLKAGPLRARVARGETVTVVGKDGVERTIGPSDVVGVSEDPGVVLILDTPSTAHIPSLVQGFESGAFSKYWGKAQEKKDHALRVVFHLCGNDVFEHERYKAFIKGFKDDVHHIIASKDHASDPITFTSAAFNQLRLNQLDSDIFPVPKYSLEVKKALDTTDLPSNTDCMRAHTIIDIRPPRPPLRDSEAEANDLFHPAVLSGEPPTLSDATKTQFSEARARIDEATVPNVIGKDVMVVTLGTGSAVPSKYRNVSGTLLHIPGAGYLLLDAGEGTWGQLSRNYGAGVWAVLRSLKCIFISHIHGDHHIGLAKILAMRQQLDPPPEEPLYIISNRMVFLYLRDYNALEELGFSEDARARVVPILSDEIHWRNKGRSGWNHGDQDQKGSRPAAAELCKTLRLQKINTVEVEHRARCHGLIVKHLDGWSVVFSGDTVPTQNLVQAGAGTTLLIHEATMANDQVEMARAKMHSTFGQAIDIGKSMNAQNILLTHFSARYPKMPPSISERQAGDPVVAFAFDHANIKIGDMWKMSSYTRAIEQSFIDISDIEGEEPEVIDAGHVDIS